MKPARALSSSILVAAISFAAAGCVDTDTAVFVDANIDAPSFTLKQVALGTQLEGSFQLTLHLGARAAGESEVTYGTFSLVDSKTGDVVVDNLAVSPSEPAPVTVDPGGADTAVTFTVDTGGDLLPADVADKLCADTIEVRGVIHDSLSTTETPVRSDAVSVGGC